MRYLFVIVLSRVRQEHAFPTQCWRDFIFTISIVDRAIFLLHRHALAVKTVSSVYLAILKQNVKRNFVVLAHTSLIRSPRTKL